jgi:hypothetical protein
MNIPDGHERLCFAMLVSHFTKNTRRVGVMLDCLVVLLQCEIDIAQAYQYRGLMRLVSQGECDQPRRFQRPDGGDPLALFYVSVAEIEKQFILSVAILKLPTATHGLNRLPRGRCIFR